MLDYISYKDTFIRIPYHAPHRLSLSRLSLYYHIFPPPFTILYVNGIPINPNLNFNLIAKHSVNCAVEIAQDTLKLELHTWQLVLVHGM